VSLPAEIIEFSSLVDPATRTFRATLLFETPEEFLVLPGMTAKVVIEQPRRGLESEMEGFAIPSLAIFSDEQGNPKVWVVAPDTMTVKAEPIRIGHYVEDKVEVYSDALKPGSVIAISGVAELRDGDTVIRMGN
jgi:multidrug efflux pump subunit AcrA (membrane-fusion protein)